MVIQVAPRRVGGNEPGARPAGRPPPVKHKTEGPKGRSISAQGEALGFAVPLAGGLKGRARLPFQGKGLVGCGVSQGFALG